MEYVTELNKDSIYRNSKDWYEKPQQHSSVHRGLIDLCVQQAGKRILDIGCATGNYCLELTAKGFECTGVDINEAYIRQAQQRNVKAYLAVAGQRLAFQDKSFDTVIMFEVLEHADNIAALLGEAKRLARKNILITVPDCSCLDILRRSGLAYEHCLELDHRHFFTREELEKLLAGWFKKYTVMAIDPLVLWRVDLPRWVRVIPGILYRLKIIRPKIYSRLVAIVDVSDKEEP